LIHELRGRGFTNIVQVGSARHLAMGTVGAITLPGVLSWVDQLTLEESIALISQANLFVGIDSGMLHIAAAVQTPAVGLWGPTSSHLRFSPANARSFVTSRVECQGCHHRVPRLHWMTGCPFDIKCMKAIQVDEVLKACLSRLHSKESDFLSATVSTNSEAP
jgi:ADP-heptose:LPS heptosyltransferase